MATKLKTYDFTAPSELTMADKAVYPWDEWFDGDIWQITQGEDFQGHPLMMERIIRTRATGKHAKVSLRHIPKDGEQWGIIVLQRTDIAGPNEVKATARREKAAATRAANAKPVKKATKVSKRTNGAVAKTAPSKRPAKKLATASLL